MRKITQRAFAAKFKQEALKRIGNGHSSTVVARELCVTPQTLRIWPRHWRRTKLRHSKASLLRPSRWRCRGCALRIKCLSLDLKSQKKRRRTSRRICCEVQLDRHCAKYFAVKFSVRGAVGQSERLPVLETGWHRAAQASERYANARIDS